VTGVLLAGLAAAGVYLLVSPPGHGQRSSRPGVGLDPRRAVGEWLAQAGASEVGWAQFVAVVAALAAIGAVLGWALFGGVVAAAVASALGACIPLASYRSRRSRRLEEARRAWPRMIEEIRLQTSGLGRSIPQALLDVGRRGPPELRASFLAAEREWSVSTDFARTVAVLKASLADATADAVCETLLVAHQVGGSGVDRRLAALAEDRLAELDGRQDALARQAGARFARRFVLLVPLGMALAGLSIGDGRAAYETAGGQLAVAFGISAVVVCWMWAGRLMRLPDSDRVFRD